MGGTILIIVGFLFSSFGAWRLWPVSASNNTHDLIEQEPQSSESSMIETEHEGTSHHAIVALWMAIFPIICLYFWIVARTSDANGFVQSVFIFSTPFAMVSTILAIRKYGMKFFGTMFPSVVLATPISIWEYFNEIENGCSTWGWGTCPPSPPGYHLPRTAMLLYLFFLGICAMSQDGNEENKPRSYGFAYAAGFGYLMFVFAHFNGVFG